MSLFALPVTAAELQTLQGGLQFYTNAAQATAQAAAINQPGSTQSVFTYAAQLLDANISYSQVAMAVSALMEGGTVAVGNATTPNTLTLFSTVFLPPQVANALANGYEPTVYAAEALGLALASNDSFNTNFVSLSNAQFAQAVATLTGVNVNAISTFVNNWTSFYTTNPQPGLTTKQAAFGAAFGDAVGIALLNPTTGNLYTQFGTDTSVNNFSPNTVSGLVANALLTIATGQYTEGTALGALPTHTPLQGEAAVPVGQLNLTINADTPPQFETFAADSVFNANPGSNVLGPSNTLNAGDNLVASGAANGTSTLNYSAVTSLLGNPALATGVSMSGIKFVNITNNSAGPAGFSGNISGVTDVEVRAGTNGNVILGTAAAGLNTALQNVRLSADGNFTAFFSAAALVALDQTINIRLNTPDSSMDLIPNGAGVYETAVITPEVAADFDLDASIATIQVNGSQALTMDAGSTALNLATLVTFDGTAATGPLTIAFGGAGDVVVDGGSAGDSFTFPAGNGAGAVTVRGNGGNDIFTFLTTAGGTTTFTDNDNADGGAGTNLLVLEADTGEILLGGVIANIGTVRHVQQDGGTTTGLITANMANSGSATTLELAGQYGGNDVTVNNLVNTKTVLFSGDNIDDLTLNAANLITQVNLTVAQTAAGGTQNINDLNVANGLNLVSAGNATTNLIEDVSDVNNDVLISGAHQLNFGFLATNAKATNNANAYDFNLGVIDATGLTGGLSIGLAEGKQQLALGTGNDLVHIWQQDTGTAKLLQMGPLATGGSDIVEFHDTFGDGTLSITPTTLAGINYTRVEGFNVANDVFRIDAGAGAFEIPIVETNGTAVFNPPAIFLMSVGQVVNLSAQFIDIIKFDTAVGAFTTPQTLFNNAIGGGSITVAGAGNEHLAMLYNNDNGVALVFTVDDGGGVINTGDDVDVLAVIPMSFTDYQTFGNNGSIAFT